MRPIDADALKELFSEVIGRIAIKPEMNGNLEHMIRASAMVIQMIDDAPSIQPEQRWVPCSERFPNKFEDVWVTDNRDRVAVCHRGHSGWRDAASGDWMYYLDSIVAWMPYYVPEPYQERGDQDGMEK